jgi:hypothetical protein
MQLYQIEFIPIWLLYEYMLFQGYNYIFNDTSLIPAYAGIPLFQMGQGGFSSI